MKPVQWLLEENCKPPENDVTLESQTEKDQKKKKKKERGKEGGEEGENRRECLFS